METRCHTARLSMELLEGRSLRSAMRMRADRKEPFPLERGLQLAERLCEALSYAHERGLVHRDVKPENIWVQPDGSPKLMDFGLARLLSKPRARQEAGAGTLAYAAPEQLEDAASAGASSGSGQRRGGWCIMVGGG